MEMNYNRFNDENNNYNEDNEKLKLINNENNYNDLEQNITKKPIIKVPEFVLNNRDICDKAMTKVLCCNKYKSRDKIDQEELRAYYQLKELALISYNEQIKEHENCLKSLFISALNVEISDNLESAEWKSIGFQVNNLNKFLMLLLNF
jgi:hypothetical protein